MARKLFYDNNLIHAVVSCDYKAVKRILKTLSSSSQAKATELPAIIPTRPKIFSFSTEKIIRYVRENNLFRRSKLYFPSKRLFFSAQKHFTLRALISSL